MHGCAVCLVVFSFHSFNEFWLWVAQVADELVAESTSPDGAHISPDQVYYILVFYTGC
jgi:hypothetical protein